MAKIVKSNSFISEKVWGGNKLSALKNLSHANTIGETWEISTHKDGSSMLGDIPLSEFCSLSYIVKFIDTSDNLSVQVHPDDAYAKQYENSKGKTECWIILAAGEGAGIYLGFKEGVTKKEFFNAVDSGLPVDKYLNFIPVKKGDFFYLAPGSVHAIGKDVTLCEVQQSSGITYRVWDWNRVGLDGKPRELHIEKAKDVLNFNHEFNQDLLNRKKTALLDKTQILTLAEHEDFKVQLFADFTGKEIQLSLQDKDALIVLEGELAGDITLAALESAIVLEGGAVSLQVATHTSFLIVSE